MKRLPLIPDNRSGPLRFALGVTRAGASLSEALVALMIMAIGVISLASLFPIAVLKTARANQLTVSTDIRYNAEAMIKVYPWIVADPNPFDQPVNGVADGNPFNDYDFSTGGPFLFDPLALIPGRPLPMPASVGLLPRYGGGFNLTPTLTAEAADGICSGPDTWTLLHDAPITTTAPTTQIDLADLNTVTLPAVQPAPPVGVVAGAAQMRVQIFYNGGKSSLTRNITGISGATKTLLFTEDVNGNNMLDIGAGEDQNGNLALDTHALPAGIIYETARLESRERRYTWLLTVRPQDAGGSFTGGIGAKPSFDVNVVVYFGRGFSPQEEQIYGTLPPGVPAILNPTPGPSTVNLQEGNRSFTVTWTGTDSPLIKLGGGSLDAPHGYWYQIEKYSDPTGLTFSDVTLTSTILESSTLVAFPRGVVDVFPIKPQTPSF